MRDFLKQAATVAISIAVTTTLLWLVNPEILVATIPSTPGPWDTAFEADPLSTESISEADDQMRLTRSEVRFRLQVGHRIGTMDDSETAEDLLDDGAHREGSARAFFQDTAPTAVSAPLNSGQSAAFTGVTAAHSGRLWVGSIGSTTKADYDGQRITAVVGRASDNLLKVVNESGTLEPVSTVGDVPVGAIILWDQSTGGDEDCDGVLETGNGEICPCGYTEATAFRNLMIRGADTIGGSDNFPNGPGVNCDGSGCIGGSGTNAQYDDVLQVAELPAHTHDLTIQLGNGAGTGEPAVSNSAGSSETSVQTTGNGTGGLTSHFHPFRTVVFCRRNGA